MSPQIGDVRRLAPGQPDPSDLFDDPPAEPLDEDSRDARIRELEGELAKATPPADLRRWAERVQQRNAELEAVAAENAHLRRQLGLAHAGVDPDSLFGQTVLTAATHDDVSDPAAVAALARTLRAEMTNGGVGRQED